MGKSSKNVLLKYFIKILLFLFILPMIYSAPIGNINIQSLDIESEFLTNTTSENLTAKIQTNYSSNIDYEFLWYKNSLPVYETFLDNESSEITTGNLKYLKSQSLNTTYLTSTNNILKYFSNNSLIFNISTINDSVGFEIDLNENTYISNLTSIIKYDSFGNQSFIINFLDIINNSYSVLNSKDYFDIDSNGNIYVLVQKNNSNVTYRDSVLLIYNSTGNYVKNITINNSKLNYVVVDEENLDGIFVLGEIDDLINDEQIIIYKYNKSGFNYSLELNQTNLTQNISNIISGVNVQYGYLYLTLFSTTQSSSKQINVFKLDTSTFNYTFNVFADGLVSSVYTTSVDYLNNLYISFAQSLQNNLIKVTSNLSQSWELNSQRQSSSFTVTNLEINSSLGINLLGNYLVSSNTTYSIQNFQFDNLLLNQLPNVLTNLSFFDSLDTSVNDDISICVNSYHTTNKNIYSNISCSDDLNILSNPSVLISVNSPLNDSNFAPNFSINLSVDINSTNMVDSVYAILSNSTYSQTYDLVNVINTTTYFKTILTPLNYGEYNVSFFANDSYFTYNSTLNYTFNVLESVNVTLNFVPILNFSSEENKTLNLTINLYDNNNLLYRLNNVNSSVNLTLINKSLDIEYITYNDEFALTFFDTVLDEISNQTVGFDRHTELSSVVVTYAVETDYNFSSARLIMSYANYTFTNSDNLRVFKCSDYNFTLRTCPSDYFLVSENITQNDSSETFSVITDSFSSYAIKELTDSQISQLSSGSTAGWSSLCDDDELYNITTDECYDIDIVEDLGIPQISSAVIKAVTLKDLPDFLFDITFALFTYSINSLDDLSSKITFESFGTKDTPVNLTFKIFDSTGLLLSEYKKDIVVQTELVIIENFEKFKELELEYGDYTISLNTVYGSGVEDTFTQKFKFSKPKQSLTKVIVISLLLIIILGLLIFKFGYKDRFNKTQNMKFSKNKKTFFIIIVGIILILLLSVKFTNAIDLESQTGEIKLYLTGTGAENMAFSGEWFRDGELLITEHNQITIPIDKQDEIDLDKTKIKSKLGKNNNQYVIYTYTNQNDVQISFLKIYDENFNEEFSKEFNQIKLDDIYLDSEDNFYIIYEQVNNAVIEKYNGDGEFIWTNSYSAKKSPRKFSQLLLYVDSDDNLYFTGKAVKLNDIDRGQLYVAKLDNDGDLDSKYEYINSKKNNPIIRVDSKNSPYFSMSESSRSNTNLYQMKLKDNFKYKSYTYQRYEPTNLVTKLEIDNNDYVLALSGSYTDKNVNLILDKINQDRQKEFTKEIEIDFLVDFYEIYVDILDNIFVVVSGRDSSEFFYYTISKFNSNGDELFSQTQKLSSNKIITGIDFDDENLDLQIFGVEFLDEESRLFIDKHKIGFISFGKPSDTRLLVDIVKSEFTYLGGDFSSCITPYDSEDILNYGERVCTDSIELEPREKDSIQEVLEQVDLQINSPTLEDSSLIFSIINLSVNVTPNSQISSVIAQITLPDFSREEITLQKSLENTYTNTYTLTNQTGDITIKFKVLNQENTELSSKEIFIYAIENIKPSLNSSTPVNNSKFTIQDSIQLETQVFDKYGINSVQAKVINPQGIISTYTLINISDSQFTSPTINTDILGEYSYNLTITDNNLNILESNNFKFEITEKVLDSILITSPDTTKINYFNDDETLELSGIINCNNNCDDYNTNLIPYSNKGLDTTENNFVQEITYNIQKQVSETFQTKLILNQNNLGENFKWDNNCNDIRIYDNFNQVNYWVEKCDSNNNEIIIWLEILPEMTKSNNLELSLTYGNSNYQSTSNPNSIFKTGKIHLTTGKCTNSNLCDMDNHNEADTLRENIENGNLEIYGEGYVDELYRTQNPYGSDEYYFSSYKFLFVPSEDGIYTFGTRSDDDSEIIIFDGSNYLNHQTHQIATTQYVNWHFNNACGETSGDKNPVQLKANQGYWVEYLSINGGGVGAQEMCIKKDSENFKTVNTENLKDNLLQINERTDILSNPIIEDEKEIVKSTTEQEDIDFPDLSFKCIPIQNDQCSFKFNYPGNNIFNDPYEIVVSAYLDSNNQVLIYSDKITVFQNKTELNLKSGIILNKPKNNLILDIDESLTFGFTPTDTDIYSCNLYGDWGGDWNLIEKWAYFSDNNLRNYWKLDNLNDEKGNKNLNVKGSVQLINSGGYDGGAYYNFPGGYKNYLETGINDIVSGNEVTISFWVKASGDINRKYLFRNNNELHAYGLYGKIEFDFNTVGNRWFGKQYSDVINDNKWHHIVAIYDGNYESRKSNVRIYTDGVLSSNRTSVHAYGNLNIGSKFKIGADPNGNNNWKGGLDEFRIFNRALDHNQARALFNKQLIMKSQNEFTINKFENFGKYEWNVMCTDYDGNDFWSNEDYSFEIKDVITEISNYNLDKSQYQIQSSVPLKITAINEKGIKSVGAIVTLPDDSVSALQLTKTGTDIYMTSYLVPNKIGEYKIIYQIIDSKDNIITSTEQNFSGVDLTKPEISDYLLSNNTYSTSQNINFKIKAIDESGINSVKAKITTPNNEEIIINLELIENIYISNYLIPNILGDFQLEYIVTDNSGNEIISNKQTFTSIDTTLPEELTHNSFSGNLNVDSNIQLQVSAVDNIEIKSIIAQMTNPFDRTEINLVKSSVDNLYSSIYKIPQILGEYSVKYIITDTSDNMLEIDGGTFNVVDNINPTILSYIPLKSIYNTSDNIILALQGEDNIGLTKTVVTIKTPSDEIETFDLVQSSDKHFASFYTIPNQTGNYEISYELFDTSNNSVRSDIQIITIYDDELPQIIDVSDLNLKQFNTSTIIDLSLSGTDNIELLNSKVIIITPNDKEVIIDLIKQANTFTNQYTIPEQLGIFQIKFELTDTSLNTKTSLIQTFSTLDTTLPEFEIIENLDNKTYSTLQNINLAIVATDNIGINKVTANIELSNQTVIQIPLTLSQDNTYTESYNIPELIGNYNIQYIITDSTNNDITSNIQTINVVDTTNPTILDYNSFSGIIYVDEKFDLSIKTVDNIHIENVIAQITTPLGESEFIVLDLNENNEYVGDYNVSNVIGVFNIKYLVEDSSSNLVEMDAGSLKSRDLIKPQITNFSIPDTNSPLTFVKLELTGEDNVDVHRAYAKVEQPDGEIKSYRLSKLNENDFSRNYRIPNLIGEFKIHYLLFDTSNNKQTTEINSFNSVDIINPSITSLNDLKSNLNTSYPISLGLSGKDNIGLSITRVLIEFPNGEQTIFEIPKVSDNQFSLLYTIPEMIGEYKITYRLYDTSNNSITSNIQTITVFDNKLPEILSTSNYNLEQISTNSNIDLTLVGVDNIELSKAKATITTPENEEVVIDLVKTSNEFTNSYTIPEKLGFYKIKYELFDTSLNSVESLVQTFSTLDTTFPEFTINSDLDNKTFPTLQNIDLSITATDNIGINEITANILLPNQTIIEIPLTLSQNNIYTSVYQIPELIDNYNIQYIITDGANNNISSEIQTFNIVDTTNPLITNITQLNNQNGYGINSNIDLVISGYDNIELLSAQAIIISENQSIQTIELEKITETLFSSNYIFPEQFGNYSIYYQLSDSSENVVRTLSQVYYVTDYKFEFQTNTINLSNNSVEYSIIISDENEELLSIQNSSSQTTIRLYNTSNDIEYKTFNSDLIVKINNLQLSDNTFEPLRLDKYIADNSQIITYGLENNMNFDSTFIELSYETLQIDNIDNLRFVLCEDYNFNNRTCNTQFNESNNNLIHNKLTNSFNYLTTSSSLAVGIIELPEPVENKTIETQIKKSSGSFYGKTCHYGYNIENGKTTCIEKIYNAEKVIQLQATQEVFAGQTLPQKNIRFDIFTPDISNEEELTSRLTFENFPSELTNVKISAKIFNVNSSLVSEYIGSEFIKGDDVVILDYYNFNEFDLETGNYSIVLTTNYGDNVEDYFVREFEFVESTLFEKYSTLSLVLIGLIAVIATWNAFRLTKKYNPLNITERGVRKYKKYKRLKKLKK